MKSFIKNILSYTVRIELLRLFRGISNRFNIKTILFNKSSLSLITLSKITPSLILQLLILTFSSLNSQVNTESLRSKAGEEGFSMRLNFNIGINAGNTEYLMLQSGARVDFTTTSSRIFLAGYYEFKKGNETLIADKAFAHLRYSYEINTLFAAEAFLQKEFDEFLSIKDRNLAGTGLRITAIDMSQSADTADALSLYVGIGLIHENELQKASPEITINHLRSTNYISLSLRLTKFLQLKSVGYFQPSLNDLNDYKILNETSIEFNITKHLKFNVNFRYRFDNTPPVNRKKYDFELTNGLGMQL